MEFQGLQNNIPAIIAVIIVALICLLSWYSYKKYASISTLGKTILSVLRGLSLIILFFLFMNPFFKTRKEIQVKPKVAVLLDGSESTTIEKGDYNGNDSYQSVLAQLRNAPNDIDLVFFSFGNSVQIQDPNSFSPSLPSTNLFNAIETITTSDEEFNSAILISDGIITQGKNPVVQVGNSPFPIHVIGIGDTSKVKDISIQSISTNATGFTNTTHVVDVDISQFGFENKTTELRLVSGNTIIESKALTISKDKEIESVQFEITLNSPGLKQYSIEIEPIAEEWITENNKSSFSVDVLDSRKRILHIASAIHPDVKALRTILSEDQNIELSTYTYLTETSSIKNILPTDKYDLLVFHGEPSSQVLNDLNITDSETSSLFISLPNENFTTDSKRYHLISNNSDKVYSVQFQGNSENFDHPILELTDINLNSLAPVYSSINASNEYPEAVTLFNANFQNIPTESPLLSILEQGNNRRSHLNAFGWYRMYLSPNVAERAYIEQLVINLIDWTSSNPDNRLLKVAPTKNEFNSSEPPIINASLINENGEVETAGVVEITISGDAYNSNFSMENFNNGNYRLQAPSLPNGKYSFTATARKGSREIDTQEGEFLVNESNIELANTIRNQDLLQNIASNSGGQFIDFESANNFWDNETISNQLITRTEVQESYIFPVRSLYWFLLVILLLATEWFLRKKYALP